MTTATRSSADVAGAYQADVTGDDLIASILAEQAAFRAMTWPEVPIFKTATLDHQRPAFWFAYERRAVMLAIAMRGGKSKITVDLIVNRGHLLTLILCPAKVVDTWADHVRNHAGRELTVLALDSSMTIEQRVQAAQAAIDHAQATGQQLVIVTNYEAITLAPFGPTITYNDKGQARRIGDDGLLLTAPWDFVVCDESHHLKTHGGLQRRVATKLGAVVPWKLALTGTPFAQTPLDIWGQAMFLDPGVFGSSYTKFRDEYAVMNPMVPNKVKRYVRMDDFRRRFLSFAYVVTAEEIADVVTVERPVFKTETCILSENAQRIYEELENDFVTNLGEGLAGELTVKNSMSKLLRLQQLTGGTLKDDNGNEYTVDTSKVDLLGRVFDRFPVTEPLVVFARFTADLDAIKRKAEEQGRRYAELSGRNKRKGKAAWLAGDADVLAIQIQTGREGLELVRGYNAIYYSLGFSLTDYRQSLARILGMNQHRRVTYWLLVAELDRDETTGRRHTSIDRRVYATLRKYQEITDSILTGRELSAADVRRAETGFVKTLVRDLRRDTTERVSA